MGGIISRVDVGIDPYKKVGDEFFAEALPVADEARRKKGSGPRSKPQRGWNTAAATRANARPRYRVRALFEPLPAIIPKTKTPPCRVVGSEIFVL